MILAFDLDDTLYPEITFVHSGFRAVAEHLQKNYGACPEQSFGFMLETLARLGRGKVFDECLRHHGLFRKTRVRECLSVYRKHEPQISLYEDAEFFLAQWKLKSGLFLVTDGNKLTQYAKVRALGLRPVFKKIFVTRQYGLDKEKPSLFCFEKLCQLEGRTLNEMIYIGDNPKKDFVNLKKAGGLTIRLRRGAHKDLTVPAEFEAEHVVDDFAQLDILLRGKVANWR